MAATNTIRKLKKGNQGPAEPVDAEILLATTEESFNAAAMPMIKPSKENTATIKPLLPPLKTARPNKTTKIMSISIVLFA